MYYTYANNALMYSDLCVPYTYSTNLCEPTDAFLIGLDTILNYDNINADYLLIPNTISEFSLIAEYLKNKDKCSLTYLHDSIKFNCRELKSLFRQFNTDTTFTVPLILRGLNLEPSSTNVDFIRNIILNAGSNNELGNYYKKIAFKIMYQYALGVLYGCLSINYSWNSVFSLPAEQWYNGELLDLVTTAQLIFNFTEKQILPIELDLKLKDEYQGIINNKIWNYADHQHEHTSDAFVYNSITNSITYVTDESAYQRVIINGTIIPYNEFYTSN